MRLLVFLSVLWLTAGSASGQATLCSLKLSEAPAIRGFKLGMTDADLKSKFPGIRIETPTRYGETVVNLEFTPADLSFRKGVVNQRQSVLISTQNFPEFEGIRKAGFNLVDGAIFSITAVYSDEAKWRNVDQFAEKVSSLLHIPSSWSDDNKQDGVLHLRCRGFWLRAELEGSSGRIRLTDMSQVALLESRAADKDEQNRARFKP
jgi:hypothetical protein